MWQQETNVIARLYSQRLQSPRSLVGAFDKFGIGLTVFRKNDGVSIGILVRGTQQQIAERRSADRVFECRKSHESMGSRYSRTYDGSPSRQSNRGGAIFARYSVFICFSSAASSANDSKTA